jgi:hypothetical protein
MQYFRIILLVALVLGAPFVIARALRRFGCMCQFCANRRLTFFDELAKDLQEHIRSHFRSTESRTPDTEAILVCVECKTVFDDFSGERESMEPDAGFPGREGCRTWCKICNRIVWSCDPGSNDIHCEKCGTMYEWQVDQDSGYRFLVALTDQRLLRRCTGIGNN